MKFTLFSIAALCAPAVMGMAIKPTEESTHSPMMMSKHIKKHCQDLEPECQKVLINLFESASGGDADAAQAGDAKGSHSSHKEFANSLTEEHSKCIKPLIDCGYNLKKMGFN
ncbi:hypothetical protein O9K51_05858 [Purpureocillium lavendulum]|uniref:Uncharacterized protein n=1 Tax=Purpureocillium lavendulum TaxID=1247861 RepID=A0AB34FSQ8_9HYPO|nr:hypothetical protein O9K51_05858 [Purpureocillium lavendulum]